MDILTLSIAEVLRFGIVLLRVAGIMVFAPFFSSRSLPGHVRVVFALVVALALVPGVPLSRLPGEMNLGALLGCVLSDALFGMVLGLVASFIFAGLQLAGQIISFQLGFSLANLIDPQSEVDLPVFAFLENYAGVLLFLLLNGHHWFLKAVAESFQYLPVQGFALKGPVVEEVIRLSGSILTAGVQIAGPVIAVTVLVDVVMGVIGRAAPQINILIVGMPLKILVGFGCLSISFYFLPQLLGKTYLQLFHQLHALVQRLG